MKRFALRLPLFLFFGAVVNIVVAWGYAWFTNPMDGTRADYEFRWAVTKIRIVVWQNAGRTVFYYPGYIPVHARYEVPPIVPAAIPWCGDRDVRKYRTVMDGHNYPKPPMREAFGWPWRSCWCEHLYSLGTWMPGASGGISIRKQWTGPNSSNVIGVLPLHPLWPGFAINTIFYAAVLWLPFATLGTFRRRRRIKRGLCPKCAYDLRGRASDSTTCPECGKSAHADDYEHPIR